MTNRNSDYQRMRPGESKKCLAAVASRKDSEGRKKANQIKKNVGKV